MANLSNINNILRTGSLGVGINRDPLGAFEISSATKPGIKMFNTAASGKTYEAYSDINGNYIIFDQDANDNRFVINSAGNSTFAGEVSLKSRLNLQRLSGGATTLIQFKNENGVDRAHIDFGGTNEELSFFAGGGAVENMRIDSSGGVSITPTTSTSFFYGADGTNSYINFETNNIDAAVQLYAGYSSGGYFAVGTKDSGGTLSERMRIDSSGDTHLQGNLFFEGSTSYVAGYSIRRQGANFIFTGGTTGTFFNRNGNGATDMYINASGNVGIGVTDPSARLNTGIAVQGSFLPYLNGTGTAFTTTTNIITVHSSSALGTNTTAGLMLVNNDNSNDAPSPLIAFSARSTSNTYNHTYAAIWGEKDSTGADTNWNTGSIIFATSTSTGPYERMRINPVGNVGIGTTSPNIGSNSGTAILTLKNTGTNRAVLNMTSTTPGTGPYAQEAFYNGGVLKTLVQHVGDGSTDSGYIKWFTTASGGSTTERMRITSSGKVVVQGENFVIDDVREHREEFYISGTSAYNFDVDIKNIGASGQPFEVFVAFTHYSTSYGAAYHAAYYQRSTVQSDITLIHQYFNQNSTRGGTWTVTWLSATQIRISKSAGVGGALGYGYLRVTQVDF
jgi:hypothetical protein